MTASHAPEQTVSITDVAYEFLRHNADAIPTHTQLKLHTLCYLAQGWTLAWTDAVLFDATFEARRFGPVSPQLQRALRKDATASVTSNDLLVPAQPLPDTQAGIVASVAKTYSGWPYTGFLEGLVTKEKTPWFKARACHDDPATAPVIELKHMRQHFVALDLVS